MNRKSKRHYKKSRDSSSEDSSDSYRVKSRRSGPRWDEVLPTSTSPPAAPYKPAPPPQPEEAAPAPAVKPLSPPLYSPPRHDNMHVAPYSPGGYPMGSDAQGAYDNAREEDNTEEEETQGGSNKVACIVVIVVVGLCIIIAVLLALYPKVLFGDNGTDVPTTPGQGPLGRQRPLTKLAQGSLYREYVP
ncbi:hypothetical protein MRX96_034798 [Rhipicephalus microplus]